MSGQGVTGFRLALLFGAAAAAMAVWASVSPETRVTSASDAALANALGARERRDAARAIAAGDPLLAREECGGFLTVDDVFSLVDFPMEHWDVVRDRGVLIA